MSGSVNKAFITGRIGRDAEIRTTRGGSRIGNFSIATSETWKDKRTGEKMERTEWVRVAVFNEALVNVVENHVKKGALIHVEGELRTSKWQDKQGEDRYTTEVVLTQFNGVLTILAFAPKSDSRTADDDYGSRPRQATRTDARGNPQYSGGDLDQEIPF